MFLVTSSENASGKKLPVALVWLNFTAYVVMVAVNTLANVLPLNGHTTGAVSARYPNLFTPAAYTFSIWGAIYVLVLFFLASQIKTSTSTRKAPSIGVLIGSWFTVSCIANALWLCSWHYDHIGISVVVMFVLLTALLIINGRIANIKLASTREKISRFGFQIYLGWICAATLANITVLLAKHMGQQFSSIDLFWTIAAILLGTLIGIRFIFTKRKASALAIIWAHLGILLKHLSESGHQAKYMSVIVAVILSIVVLLCFLKFVTSSVPEAKK